MTAQYLTEIELYVTDHASTVDHLRALGMTPGRTQGTPADRITTRLHRNDATVAVTASASDGEVGRFLERHGDGVAGMSFACDDVEETRRSAIAAGARPDDDVVDAIRVPGFDGVRHTLLPSGPATPEWDARTEPPFTLDHLALCVAGGDSARVSEFYQQGLGMEPFFSELTEVGAQAMDSTVVHSPSGGVTFVIVESAGSEPGQLDAFLDANGGPGVQHVALLVDDIRHAAVSARDRGVAFLDAPDAYYDTVRDRSPALADEVTDLHGTGILVDSDEWGELLQTFTRSPHPRSTLFYELVERRSARTFGTRNIRALYEAVQQQSRVGRLA